MGTTGTTCGDHRDHGDHRPWGPHEGYGDDVGMMGTMQGRRGDDMDDVGTMGTTKSLKWP